eukprot:jgi/Psemu1/51865/gm1.51865_g
MMQGEEIVRVDLGLIQKHWEEILNYSPKHVPLMLAGWFKQDDGKNTFCQRPGIKLDPSSSSELGLNERVSLKLDTKLWGLLGKGQASGQTLLEEDAESFSYQEEEGEGHLEWKRTSERKVSHEAAGMTVVKDPSKRLGESVGRVNFAFNKCHVDEATFFPFLDDVVRNKDVTRTFGRP